MCLTRSTVSAKGRETAATRAPAAFGGRIEIGPSVNGSVDNTREHASPRRLGYVPALDGIRAISILLVVAFHYARWPPGGQVGVDVFFVLSGFLITTLLLEEHAETGRIAIGRFYRRRARRLYPALAVLVAVFLLVTAAVGGNRLLVAAIGASYAANLVDAFGHPGPLMATSLNPLWSLAQEEQFYLVWPLLIVLFIRSRRGAGWIFAAAAVATIYRDVLLYTAASPHRVYYGPDARADALLIGCAFAVARFQNRFEAKEWAGKIGVGTLGFGAIFGWVLAGWAVWGEALFVFGVAFLVVAASAETEIAKMLATRPLVWLGRRSYSLYLWHLPAMYAGVYLLGNGLVGRGAALVAAVICAALSYRYVEQTFRREPRSRLQPVTASIG